MKKPRVQKKPLANKKWLLRRSVSAREEEVELNTGPCSFSNPPPISSVPHAGLPAAPSSPGPGNTDGREAGPPKNAGGPGRQDRLYLGSCGPSEPNCSGKREDTGSAYGKLENGGMGILDKAAVCGGASGPLF